MKRPRYQIGSLYLESRKNGPDVWVYRWREADGAGKRKLRKEIVGTIRELPTQADAQRAAEKLRININRQALSQGRPAPTIAGLVEHYRTAELPMATHEGKTKGTKMGYISALKNHIVPRWGSYPLQRVTAIEVENWFKTLKLAPGSKAKIRNVFSMIFRHAIRWNWLGQDENPLRMVRVSTRRRKTPVRLTAEEFRLLFAVLPERERCVGTICATTGLRISEVLGLKWEDIDFLQKTANVLRSYVDGCVGHCKTEVSQQPVPLDALTIEELLRWRSNCLYGAPEDWVFASPVRFGKVPVWPDSLRSKILQPAARKAGITKQIGWHTFRHTYSSLLAEIGNDVRVVQELMRHARLSTTMEVYTHAGMESKRIAQSRAVDVLFNRKAQTEAVQ